MATTAHNKSTRCENTSKFVLFYLHILNKWRNINQIDSFEIQPIFGCDKLFRSSKNIQTVGVPSVQSVLSVSCCRRMESSAVDVPCIYGTSWWCDKRRRRTSTSIPIWILANANFNIFVSSRSPMTWRTTARRWWICGCASVENRMDRKLNFFLLLRSPFFDAECEWRFLSFRIDPYIRLMPLLAMNFDDCSAFFRLSFPLSLSFNRSRSWFRW